MKQLVRNSKTKRRAFLKHVAAFSGMAFSAPFALSSQKSELPKVLILGDSISIGYTPFVREFLNGLADVYRPDKNCQGTTLGLKEIDNWIGNQQWDVIHFNFGLHDLKHVDPVTGKNSNLETDPQQADVKQYKANLEIITYKLQQTGAKLIFATTTPYPDKPGGPLRREKYVKQYNKAALKVMKGKGVTIDDLYAFVLPQLVQLQIPENVHFTEAGNKVIAQKVTESIKTMLN